MKKISLILTVLLMVCLTGCGGSKKNTPSIIYDDLKSAALEPVDIVIYAHGTIPSNVKDAVAGMLEQISLATRETINVYPHFEWVAYELFDAKIPAVIAADEKIDAFTCYAIGPFVEQNLCLDVTSSFKQHAPTYYNELMTNDLGRDYLTDCTADGKLYAVPYNGISNPRACVIAKEDLAKKYAPDGLETMEDYGEFLKRVKENEQGIVPGLVYSYEFLQAYMEGNGYYTSMASFVYSRWDQNGEGLYALEQTPEFMDAYELLQLWKSRGYILKNNQEEGRYPITGKSLASMLVPMNSVSDRFTYSHIENDARLKVIPLYMQSLHYINSFAQSVAVSRTCENPERLMMFMEWLHNSQKNYDLFMYGQEGVNYVLKNGSMDISQTELKALGLWKYMGAGFFQDYRYERVIANVDADFRQIYLDSSFKNVRTKGELKEQIQERREMNEVNMGELEKQYPAVSAAMDKYYSNLEKFTQAIDNGSFNMTTDDLKEKQKESGIEQALKLFQKELGF